MANHARTQLRDAAVELLSRIDTVTDALWSGDANGMWAADPSTLMWGTARCFAGRPETRPLQEDELPGLLVYTNTTTSEAASGTQGARRFVHMCELVVDGLVAGTGDLDQTLDTIEKEVRTALEAAPTLSGTAKDLWCESAEKENDEEAEQPTWRLRMHWTAEYHTREGAPDAALS